MLRYACCAALVIVLSAGAAYANQKHSGVSSSTSTYLQALQGIPLHKIALAPGRLKNGGCKKGYILSQILGKYSACLSTDWGK